MQKIKQAGTPWAVNWMMILLLITQLLINPLATAAALDMDAPTIELLDTAPTYVPGKGYQIRVLVKDNDKVGQVVLKFRPADSDTEFTTRPMRKVGVTGTRFVADVPEDLVSASAVEFYIEAQDQAGNITQAPHPATPKALARVVIPPVEKSAAPLVTSVTTENPAGNSAEPPTLATKTDIQNSLPDLGQAEPSPDQVPEKEKRGGIKYILLGVLGVAAIAGLAGGGGGGGSSSSSAADTGTAPAGTVEVAW